MVCYINCISYCGQQSLKSIVLGALDRIESLQIPVGIFHKLQKVLSFLSCKVFVFISYFDKKCASVYMIEEEA